MTFDRVPFKPDVEEDLKPQTGHEGPWIEGLDFLSDTNYLRMANFLGLSQREREDTKVAEKVSYLSDWAGKMTKSTDETMRRNAIKQLQDDLGTTYVGKDLLVYLYRYARLADEKQKLESEMNLYKKPRY